MSFNRISLSIFIGLFSCLLLAPLNYIQAEITKANRSLFVKAEDAYQDHDLPRAEQYCVQSIAELSEKDAPLVHLQRKNLLITILKEERKFSELAKFLESALAYQPYPENSIWAEELVRCYKAQGRDKDAEKVERCKWIELRLSNDRGTQRYSTYLLATRYPHAHDIKIAKMVYENSLLSMVKAPRIEDINQIFSVMETLALIEQTMGNSKQQELWQNRVRDLSLLAGDLFYKEGEKMQACKNAVEKLQACIYSH